MFARARAIGCQMGVVLKDNPTRGMGFPPRVSEKGPLSSFDVDLREIA